MSESGREGEITCIHFVTHSGRQAVSYSCAAVSFAVRNSSSTQPHTTPLASSFQTGQQSVAAASQSVVQSVAAASEHASSQQHLHSRMNHASFICSCRLWRCVGTVADIQGTGRCPSPTASALSHEPRIIAYARVVCGAALAPSQTSKARADAPASF